LIIFVKINRLVNGEQLKINYSFGILLNRKHQLLRMQIGFCHFARSSASAFALIVVQAPFFIVNHQSKNNSLFSRPSKEIAAET